MSEFHWKRDLRAAITRHPNWAEWSKANGKNAGDLTKAEVVGLGWRWGLVDDNSDPTDEGRRLASMKATRTRQGGTPRTSVADLEPNGDICRDCGGAFVDKQPRWPAEDGARCGTCHTRHVHGDAAADTTDQEDAPEMSAETIETAAAAAPAEQGFGDLTREALAKIGAGDLPGLDAWLRDMARQYDQERARADKAEAAATEALDRAREAARKMTSANAGQTGEGQRWPDLTPLSEQPLGKLFKGQDKAFRDRRLTVYDAPDAPAVDRDYDWPAWTGYALGKLAMGRHVMLWGPAGTGKTSWAEQVAARTGRPFAHVTFTKMTEAADLLGQLVPHKEKGAVWRDGPLTAAIRRPLTVVLLDEISTARPGLVAFLLELMGPTRSATLPSGEVVRMAGGVRLILADNTNGTGDQSGHYADRHEMDRALLDRVSDQFRVDYLPPAREAAILSAKTGAPLALARKLTEFANVTRGAARNGDLSHALGLRRLLSWAEGLLIGGAPALVWESAVMAAQTPDDDEALRQLRQGHLDDAELEALAAGQDAPERAAPNPEAPEFDTVKLEG